MKTELIKQYKTLVTFLGKTLGPCFEIVLHEIKEKEIKMIAIANGEISNRKLECSISDEKLNILKKKKSLNEDTMLNHTILLKNGKKIRSSSMFIKENNKIIAMLCINFDDSKFHDINKQILRIIHPDMFVKNYLADISYNISIDEDEKQEKDENINFLMEKLFLEINDELNLPTERLNKNEKEKAVLALYEKGLFNLKEAISFTAKKLNCSTTSIYRYLRKIEKKN